MGLRITTLCENTARIGDFLGEWGLSILVETDDTKVLLDAGKGSSTVYNSDTLGIDLREVDTIVLSHSHFDHTGGLNSVLRRMRKEVEVVAHPDVWQPKYSKHGDGPERFIGIPFQRAELESMGARFNLTAEPVKITDTMTTTGYVKMVTEFEQVDGGLYVKDESGLHHDDVPDDQALILRTDEGLVVISGCAHRGIINTLYQARELTGDDRIRCVIGGSHLMGTSEERVWQTVEALRGLGVEKMGLCHCTDLPVSAILAREFGDTFFFNKAGMTTVIE